MSEPLPALIRLHGWRVEDRRRALAAARARAEAAGRRLSDLAVEIDRERALCLQSPSVAGFAFPAYRARIAARRATLIAELDAAVAAVTQARDGLAQAYREKRKLELAQQGRDSAQASARAKRERIALDERGLDAHRRASADPGAC